MKKRLFALALCLALILGASAMAEESGLNDEAAAEAVETVEALVPPTADEFVERFFSRLANLEVGTAGASLKTAIAASDVCAFAMEYGMWDMETLTAEDNLLAAYETLGEDERTAAAEGFDAVRELLDGSLEDYEANRPLFEDAGVADTMDEVMNDPLNRLAWENLRDHMLALGTDENVG